MASLARRNRPEEAEAHSVSHLRASARSPAAGLESARGVVVKHCGSFREHNGSFRRHWGGFKAPDFALSTAPDALHRRGGAFEKGNGGFERRQNGIEEAPDPAVRHSGSFRSVSPSFRDVSVSFRAVSIRSGEAPSAANRLLEVPAQAPKLSKPLHRLPTPHGKTPSGVSVLPRCRSSGSQDLASSPAHKHPRSFPGPGQPRAERQGANSPGEGDRFGDALLHFRCCPLCS